MDKLQARINEAKDRLFAPFSAKVGVSSIREYEEKHVKAVEEETTQRMQITTQVSDDVGSGGWFGVECEGRLGVAV